MSGPIITALAPWFGGKRNLAPAIVEALGPHRVYWEVPCGSMAVLLAKPPCVMETAVDLHGQLINLARVLQREDTALDLYGRAARTVFHEVLHAEAIERLRARPKDAPAPEEPDVDLAYDYLCVAWFGRNGVAGTANHNHGFCVRYTANGGHAAKRWRSVVDSIPWWHDRLINVTILCRDMFGVLDRIDDAPGTAIYCDPPYLVKGARYVHDFAAADHARLADALARFRQARVVVSYYDHPDLGRLYPGWSRRHIAVTKAMASQRARDASNDIKAVEVLLVNERQPLLVGLFGNDGQAVAP